MYDGMREKAWIESTGRVTVVRGDGDMNIDDFDELVKKLVPDHESRSVDIHFDHHEGEWYASLTDSRL